MHSLFLLCRICYTVTDRRDAYDKDEEAVDCDILFIHRMIVDVNPDEPFALILPQEYGTITLYDRVGNISPLEYAETPLSFVFADRSE